MKVELEKLRLSVMALSGEVCIGTPSKDNKGFNNKKDVTSDFIKAVIEKFGGMQTYLTVEGEKEWTIIVKKYEPSDED